MYSTDTLTSWSKEGIVTEIIINSTIVKCLSNHLSSFAVIAEDPSIEIPTVATNISNTTSTIASVTSATGITATTATTTSVSKIPPTPATTSTTMTDSTVTTSMNLLTCSADLICIKHYSFS